MWPSFYVRPNVQNLAQYNSLQWACKTYLNMRKMGVINVYYLLLIYKLLIDINYPPSNKTPIDFIRAFKMAKFVEIEAKVVLFTLYWCFLLATLAYPQTGLVVFHVRVHAKNVLVFNC